MKTLFTTPRPWYSWKAEILNFLHVLFDWGVKMTSLLTTMRQRWGVELRYSFWRNCQKDWYGDSTFDRVKWGGELLYLRWIFPLILEPTYEGAIGSAIGVDYGLYDLVLVYSFLWKDLWIFPSWCVGYPMQDACMIPWHVSHLLGSVICQNLWKDSWDSGGACLSLPYTSNKPFCKLCHLAVFWLPWPHLPRRMKLSDVKSSKKRPYPSRQTNWPTWWDVM